MPTFTAFRIITGIFEIRQQQLRDWVIAVPSILKGQELWKCDAISPDSDY